MRAERRAPRRRNDSVNSTQSEWPQPTQELHVDTGPETQSQAGDALSSSSVDYFAVCQSLESMGSFNWTEEVGFPSPLETPVYRWKKWNGRSKRNNEAGKRKRPGDYSKSKFFALPLHPYSRGRIFSLLVTFMFFCCRDFMGAGARNLPPLYTAVSTISFRLEACKTGIELQKALTENKGRPIRGIMRINIEDGPPPPVPKPTERQKSPNERPPPHPRSNTRKNRDRRQRRGKKLREKKMKYTYSYV